MRDRKEWLNATQVARELGSQFRPKHVREWGRAGHVSVLELPGFHRMYDLVEVREFVAKLTKSPASAEGPIAGPA